MAIGSGGDFAEAAARALLGLDRDDHTALDVAHRAMRIAADCCVYTNANFSWHAVGRGGALRRGRATATEVLPAEEEEKGEDERDSGDGSGGGSIGS